MSDADLMRLVEQVERLANDISERDHRLRALVQQQAWRIDELEQRIRVLEARPAPGPYAAPVTR